MNSWVNKELLAKLKHENGVYRRWQQGRVTWGEYGGTVWACKYKYMFMNTCKYMFMKAKATWS